MQRDKEEKEKIFGVTPIVGILGDLWTHELNVATGSTMTESIIHDSFFLLLEWKDGSRMISLSRNSSNPTILIWECCSDNVYRWNASIHVTDEYRFRIARKMRDNTSRYADLNVF